MEPAHLVGVVKACPRCGSENTKWRYFNNAQETQPRYACKGCKDDFTYGGQIRMTKKSKQAARERKIEEEAARKAAEIEAAKIRAEARKATKRAVRRGAANGAAKIRAAASKPTKRAVRRGDANEVGEQLVLRARRTSSSSIGSGDDDLNVQFPPPTLIAKVGKTASGAARIRVSFTSGSVINRHSTPEAEAKQVDDPDHASQPGDEVAVHGSELAVSISSASDSGGDLNPSLGAIGLERAGGDFGSSVSASLEAALPESHLGIRGGSGNSSEPGSEFVDPVFAECDDITELPEVA